MTIKKERPPRLGKKTHLTKTVNYAMSGRDLVLRHQYTDRAERNHYLIFAVDGDREIGRLVLPKGGDGAEWIQLGDL